MTESRVKVWVQRFKDRPHLVLQWLDPETGKRKSKSAGTDDTGAAEQARSDLEYELNHGKYQAASRLTWEAFRDLFEDEVLPGKRPNTQLNYRATFDLFERLCGPARLRSVTERTVSAFAAAMRREPGRKSGSGGMLESTVHNRLQFLRTALAWATAQKMIPAVPHFPAVRVPRKRPQPVPAESFERIIAAAPDAHMRAYLLCGWLAGLRLVEALQLEWEPTEKAPYLDLGRDQIVLPAELVKGVEDQWVPLDPLLREALEALPGEHEGPVFNFAGPHGPLTASGVGSRVVALAKRAGVRLTMKSLRRGFGCRYAGKVSAQVLQKLMRHSNIKTTLDYYANVDDAVREAVLGQKCNSSRNKEGSAAGAASGRVDATQGRGTAGGAG